jgi:hypothetical protein
MHLGRLLLAHTVFAAVPLGATFLFFAASNAAAQQPFGWEVAPAATPAPYAPPSAPLEDERDVLAAPRLSLGPTVLGVGYVHTRAEVSGRSSFDQRLQGRVGGGGSAWLDFPLLPFVSVGAGVGLASWTTDEEADSGFDRSWLATVSGHVTLSLPATDRWGGYFRIPLGVSVDFSDSEWVENGSLSPLPGWHAGGVLGGYLGGYRFGVSIEVGVLVHHVRSRISFDGSREQGTLERRMTTVPMSLNLVWLI